VKTLYNLRLNTSHRADDIFCDWCLRLLWGT